jgi:hypothetical protein
VNLPEIFFYLIISNGAKAPAQDSLKPLPEGRGNSKSALQIAVSGNSVAPALFVISLPWAQRRPAISCMPYPGLQPGVGGHRGKGALAPWSNRVIEQPSNRVWNEWGCAALPGQGKDISEASKEVFRSEDNPKITDSKWKEGAGNEPAKRNTGRSKEKPWTEQGADMEKRG